MAAYSNLWLPPEQDWIVQLNLPSLELRHRYILSMLFEDPTKALSC